MRQAVNTIRSTKELIGMWATRAEFAHDLNSAFPELPITVSQVQKWAEKDAIPSRYLHAVLVVAKRSGHDVTADQLIEFQSAAFDTQGPADARASA
ncbi:hypothetical protein [Roseovarius pacificus]|uniref:hypothetical protein n=1 Tax=Roseovarius pacificus TaxID=337701 RepID=UPI002A18C3A2|nr:hypothetical protein [Roseovarius pacificus]